MSERAAANPYRAPPRPTGYFSEDGFLLGARALCGSGREPLHTRHSYGRAGLAPVETFRYRATVEDAALACARAGRFAPEHSIALLNVMRDGAGPDLVATDCRAVRGQAVRLPGGPPWSIHRPPEEGDRCPPQWVATAARLQTAGAECILIVDPIGCSYWAVLPLDGPDYLHGNSERIAAYRAQNGRFAAALGCVAEPDPLLTALPMPGAAEHREIAPGEIVTAPVSYYSPSEIHGRPTPRYGSRFEDLDEVIARIEATPATDILSEGEA